MDKMVDYSKLPRNDVLCLDMKSFYASVEAVGLGLDPLSTLLVVVGSKERQGSVVLAASPMMKKKYGIRTGSRLYEVPTHDPSIHVVEARMTHYLHISTALIKLLNRFAPMEAIHVYSVDEAWVCTNGTEKLFGSRWDVARKIKKTIYDEFGLHCAIGIGDNKLLAKLILDLEAKKSGIAECTYEEVQTKLWKHPVREIWGIGSRMEKNLHRLGIRTLGQVANYSLEVLVSKFGVMGEQLFAHSWGIDNSPVIGAPDIDYQKGFASGIQLLRDYKELTEIKRAILDQVEEVCRRARTAKLAGRTIHFGMGYSVNEGGGGFYRQKSIEIPTNVTMDVYGQCLQIMKEQYTGKVVRSLSVSLSQLSSDEVVQLDLFENTSRKRELGYVMDTIREKYGSTSLLRASSYAEGGTILYRSKLVGGHKA
jgi:DNA polymerase V